jgi:hypothetical protein
MDLIQKCKTLIDACKEGKLGSVIMPEDTNPGFTKSNREFQIAYFTLPMALNYQRDSFKLWEAALKTYNDPETKVVFDVEKVSKMSDITLRKHLMKYKLALQPNKHVATWQTIAKKVFEEWGSFEHMFSSVQHDFLKLRNTVQVVHKKNFPYLSGPKIFNYWSSILKRYAGVELENIDHVEIAVDTHILKCSVLLEVITKEESEKLSTLEISYRWRKALEGSGIAPLDIHFVLWFWSRNGFLLKV